MHAVVNEVEIDASRKAEAEQLLHEIVLPRAKALAGFKSGTWFRSLDGTQGRGVLLFESEDAAKAAVEQIRSQGPPSGR
jgi:glutathione synthase/RimK-type ligase-like ATP-grasp enzyme